MIIKSSVFCLIVSVLFSCKNISAERPDVSFGAVTASSSIAVVSVTIPPAIYSSSSLSNRDSLSLKIYRNVYYFKNEADTCSLLIDFNFEDKFFGFDSVIKDNNRVIQSRLLGLLHCIDRIQTRQIQISGKSATEFYCKNACFIVCYLNKGTVEIMLQNVNSTPMKDSIVKSIKIG